jgi:16S rRNA (guanine(966)-N(2))-methyltransferase RsmD
MGIEALSRGASRCCFAEMDRQVLDSLKRNIETLGCQDRSTIWAGDVERRLTGWLAGLDRPADLVFVDPPYATSRIWDWPAMIAQTFEPLAAALAGDGLLVLRTPDDVELPQTLGDLKCVRRKSYGSMRITTWGRPTEPADE